MKLFARTAAIAWAVAIALGASSCIIVHERGPARCPDAVWVTARYDRWGRWHPGYWRCPHGAVVVAPP